MCIYIMFMRVICVYIYTYVHESNMCVYIYIFMFMRVICVYIYIYLCS